MKNWYESAIFYNLYPLGCSNKRRENDYTLSTQGLELLSKWSEHIVSLGCNAVYLGPVFQSKTHGYDTTDYKLIDSRLGTNGQFKALVEDYHRKGIRVVLDGVFNHTGRDFFAFRDILEKKSQSVYKDWYCGVNFGGDTPFNDGFGYEAWRGHFELPRLNLLNPQVVAHLFEAVAMWIDQWGIDGIRLDCADCLDFGFMRELRRFTTSKRQDFWLMGEIIHGDYTRWANEQTLHSVTNYECSKGLYSSHNDGNMHEIAHTLSRQFGDGGIYKNLLLYSFVDNHDLDRIADIVKNPSYLETLYILLYTIPGLPSIYYGSEWGIHGVSDRVTDWNLRPFIDIETAKIDNPRLMQHIKTLVNIRTNSNALQCGSYKQLHVSAKQFAFARGDGDQQIVVIINSNDHPAELNLPFASGICYDLLKKDSVLSAQNGRIIVKIPAYGGCVLSAKNIDNISSIPQTIVEIPVQAPQEQMPTEQQTVDKKESYSRKELLRRCGNLSTLYSARNMVMQDGKAAGLNVIEVKSLSGLHMLLSKDRCLDILELSFNGTNIGFMSKNGVQSNTYATAGIADFKRYWAGGMLSTCGLRNTGFECTIDGEYLPMHGYIGVTPAENVGIYIGDDGEIIVTGTMRESLHSGHSLEFRRKITVCPEKAIVTIEDEIFNNTPCAEPIFLLYHFNYGYPFLDEGLEITFPDGEVIGKTPLAQENIATNNIITQPINGQEEVCYFYKPNQNDVCVTAYNKKLGIESKISYDAASLPVLTQWKSMGSGDYALGIEPGTSHLKGRKIELENGYNLTVDGFSSKKFAVQLSLKNKK